MIISIATSIFTLPFYHRCMIRIVPVDHELLDDIPISLAKRWNPHHEEADVSLAVHEPCLCLGLAHQPFSVYLNS